MYYKDEDLIALKDSEGRRLYLRAEFNDRSGFHKSEDVVYNNIKNKTINEPIPTIG